jgi:NAD+ synthase
MSNYPKIILAQLNFTVGDIKGNIEKILATLESNSDAELIVFPELCISGYPPEDLMLLPYFAEHCINNVKALVTRTKEFSPAILIGTPWVENGKTYNAALLIQNGEIKFKQFKISLPNYGVFDEKRVFSAGEKLESYNFNGVKLGIIICEDIWNIAVASQLKDADVIISINASPYEAGKHQERVKVVSRLNTAYKKPVLYLNQICGQDDIIFDGGSFIINEHGDLRQFSFFSEELIPIEGYTFIGKHQKIDDMSENEKIYQAMMLGLRDYVRKNGFPSVILGMSGGVDSALTAAIAVDALGSEKVHLVMLPSKFTSSESLKDAEECSNNLCIKIQNIPISEVVEAFDSTLEPSFTSLPRNLTEENIQARSRGVLLMALSNKFNHLLLTTGNKSEVAVGYSTLYGDMCGGYNLIKDIYKTKVFELCRWRNNNIPKNSFLEKLNVIPENIIIKAPTAELRDNQKDEDSLPPYPLLDKILYALIEQQKPVEDIVAANIAPVEVVEKIAKLLYLAEYKRRQAAPGVKISTMSFNRDRRFPITTKFKFRKC